MGVITKRETKKGVSYRAVIRRKGESAITKTFERKAQAQDWMNKVEAKIVSGKYREDKQNFGDLIDKYINEINPIKPIGRSKMYNLLSIQRDLGHHKLKDLTAEVLQDYALNRGACPSTIKSDFSYIGVVLNTAESLWGCKPKFDDYKRATDSLNRLGVISSSNERERRVTDTEIDILLASAKTTLPIEDIVRFAVATSMRASEITNLRWAELSEDCRSVVIRERKHPKKKKDEVVPLMPAAREIILRQPRTTDKTLIPVGTKRVRDKVPACELIFPYNIRSITTAFQRAVKESDLTDLRFHDLRHEGISRLFELGLDSMVVATFSGHRDINMLRRYTHINANKVLQMLDA